MRSHATPSSTASASIARSNPTVPTESASEAGPEEVVQTDWLAWRVHRAFGELPETERAVLELAYWGGLSQSEIADFLGIPLGTVKTRTEAALHGCPTCSREKISEDDRPDS